MLLDPQAGEARILRLPAEGAHERAVDARAELRKAEPDPGHRGRHPWPSRTKAICRLGIKLSPSDKRQLLTLARVFATVLVDRAGAHRVQVIGVGPIASK